MLKTAASKAFVRMELRRHLIPGCIPLLLFAPLLLAETPQPPLPDIHQLLAQVQQHQKQVESMRENYTYDSVQTRQNVDASGQVKKTEIEEREQFYVNGHLISRLVKKDGVTLNGDAEKKEDARVMDLVAKAQKTPPEQRLQGPSITVSRILELMDLRSPRREMYRGRPTIVFDFVGRRDAKTHGMMEDASKKLQGTVYIDEADLQVAHLEVRVDDNLKFGGGLLASLEKGSTFRFDQAPVEGGLWLPTGSEANMQAKLFLFKNLREHLTQRDFGFRRFGVETGETAQVKPVVERRRP